MTGVGGAQQWIGNLRRSRERFLGGVGYGGLRAQFAAVLEMRTCRQADGNETRKRIAGSVDNA